MKTDTMIEAMEKVIQFHKTMLKNIRSSGDPHIVKLYNDDNNNISKQIQAMEFLVESGFPEYMAGQLNMMKKK